MFKDTLIRLGKEALFLRVADDKKGYKELIEQIDAHRAAWALAAPSLFWKDDDPAYSVLKDKWKTEREARSAA